MGLKKLVTIAKQKNGRCKTKVEEQENAHLTRIADQEKRHQSHHKVTPQRANALTRTIVSLATIKRFSEKTNEVKSYPNVDIGKNYNSKDPIGSQVSERTGGNNC